MSRAKPTWFNGNWRQFRCWRLCRLDTHCIHSLEWHRKCWKMTCALSEEAGQPVHLQREHCLRSTWRDSGHLLSLEQCKSEDFLSDCSCEANLKLWWAYMAFYLKLLTVTGFKRPGVYESFVRLCQSVNIKWHAYELQISNSPGSHCSVFFRVTYEPHRHKTNKMVCAPREDSDQPGHRPSLISLRCALNW